MGFFAASKRVPFVIDDDDDNDADVRTKNRAAAAAGVLDFSYLNSIQWLLTLSNCLTLLAAPKRIGFAKVTSQGINVCELRRLWILIGVCVLFLIQNECCMPFWMKKKISKNKSVWSVTKTVPNEFALMVRWLAGLGEKAGIWFCTHGHNHY